MPAFPRTIPPRDSDWPKGPAPLVSRARSSKPQIRPTNAAGLSWEEFWPPLNGDLEAVRAFLADIEYWAGQGITVTLVPWFGRTAKGTIAQGNTGAVNGVSQSGNMLVTDGWPNGGTVKKGDYITVVGVPYGMRIMADAAADGAGNLTFTINPSIFVGSEPLDNAVVTLNGSLNAKILEVPEFPRVSARSKPYYAGLTLLFVESRE